MIVFTSIVSFCLLVDGPLSVEAASASSSTIVMEGRLSPSTDETELEQTLPGIELQKMEFITLLKDLLFTFISKMKVRKKL